MATVASGPTTPGAAFVSKYCNISDVYVNTTGTERGLLAHMEDTASNTAAAATAPPPMVQQVGHAPGHGGQRCGLRRRVTPAVPRGGSRRGSPQARLPVTRGPIHDQATTRALVRDAQAARMVLRWRPGFTKGGKSGERYQFYSRARTFAQFDALTKETFVSGIAGGNRAKATRESLLYDAARGTVTFVDAATPPEAAPGGIEPANSDDGLSDAEEGVESTSSGGESDTDGAQPVPAAPKQTVGFGR